ncbi:MAG: Eco57I restriction-modification methylase domain-containing protein, partial [Gemmatimonadaceae bacterium]
MRSLESFAALLAATGTHAGLAALASELGFADNLTPLDADTQASVGLSVQSFVRSAHVATAAGALRALLIECDNRTSLRVLATAVAQHCSSHAPQVLWLLIATQYNGCELTVATWSADRSKPRVVALHIDRTHVVPSDAETFAALAAASDEPEILRHSAWLDTLGRDALTRRFYRTLELVVANLADSAAFTRSTKRVPTSERGALALLYVSRLLFLSFLQTKGWLDHDRRFLENSFARCMERSGDYHRKVLLPLFFGTLNTPPNARAAAARAFGRIPFLNGGLFARTHLERKHPDLQFPDDTLGVVFGELLARYRFSPREESANWSEAAVDPEMLGKAFESLMEANARRASGAFYTPRRLVATVSHAALTQALSATVPPDVARAALDGQMPNEHDAERLRARCASLTILDPACGSGAFLVHVLELLATLRAKLGDPRPVWQLRRDMLTKSIFGVDINPTAVWLCELRLWLSVVIDCDVHDPMLVPPLPNLDRHIRIGDSLAGDPFDPDIRTHGTSRLAQLRERYARSSGPRKHTLQRALDRAERTLVVAHLERQLSACSARRRDILSALRGRDLFGTRATPASVARERLAVEREHSRSLTTCLRDVRNGGALPFAWITHFPDVARLGGFTTILGNPPWVRLHRIPASARIELRRRFTSYRNAPWSRGATAARATLGFAAQVDLAALFAERALALLQPGGTLALLLPTKLWRALAGGGLRAALHERAHLISIEDWSEAPRQFEAAVYPSMLVAARHQHPTLRSAEENETRRNDMVRATVHQPNRITHWCTPRFHLGFDEDPASPWLLAPPPVRDAFDRLASAGLPLVHSPLGPPQLGVKCGLNDAFIVRCIDAASAVATVHDGHRTGRVERHLLRPLLRGEGLSAWRQSPNGSGEWIVWTHDARGAPLRTLPPHAHAWLAPGRAPHSRRADARSRGPWWALFRTGGSSSARA